MGLSTQVKGDSTPGPFGRHFICALRYAFYEASERLYNSVTYPGIPGSTEGRALWAMETMKVTNTQEWFFFPVQVNVCS